MAAPTAHSEDDKHRCRMGFWKGGAHPGRLVLDVNVPGRLTGRSSMTRLNPSGQRGTPHSFVPGSPPPQNGPIDGLYYPSGPVSQRRTRRPTPDPSPRL